MGKRGPPPKSAEVLRLTGNPGHRRKERLAEPTFAPPLKAPTCPRFLSKTAKAEWRRLVPLLLARGTLAEVDRGCLAMLCQAWADHVEAESVLAELGPDNWFAHATGRPHPALRVSNRAMQIVLKLSKAFGLSPASRDSVSPSTPASPRGGSGWSQFDDKGA